MEEGRGLPQVFQIERLALFCLFRSLETLSTRNYVYVVQQSSLLSTRLEDQ